MKKLKIGLFTSIIIFLLLVALGVGFAFYIKKTDNIVYWASEIYPLGSSQKYIIQVNDEVKNTDGTIDLPAGLFYTFILPGETQQSPYVSGRQISTTLVDLNQYLGKEVYIQGHFTESIPLFLKRENIPEYFVTSQRATLNIQSVKIAQ